MADFFLRVFRQVHLPFRVLHIFFRYPVLSRHGRCRMGKRSAYGTGLSVCQFLRQYKSLSFHENPVSAKPVLFVFRRFFLRCRHLFPKPFRLLLFHRVYSGQTFRFSFRSPVGTGRIPVLLQFSLHFNPFFLLRFFFFKKRKSLLRLYLCLFFYRQIGGCFFQCFRRSALLLFCIYRFRPLFCHRLGGTNHFYMPAQLFLFFLLFFHPLQCRFRRFQTEKSAMKHIRLIIGA